MPPTTTQKSPRAEGVAAPHAYLHPHHARDIVGRGSAVVGLAGIALIHVLDLPSKFSETPYVGFLYLGLILGCIAGAAILIAGSARAGWLAATVLATGAIAAFVVSRSVGLPHATDDIGNWLEPLGLAALFVETCVLALGVHGLALERARART